MLLALLVSALDFNANTLHPLGAVTASLHSGHNAEHSLALVRDAD